MGLSEEQSQCSMRFSVGKWTSEEDIDRGLEVMPNVVAKLRAMSPLIKTTDRR